MTRDPDDAPGAGASMHPSGRVLVAPPPETVREETLAGDPHLVAPVIAAVEGVAKDRFLAFDELVASAPEWNGQPITATHPTSGPGRYESAGRPEHLDRYVFGRFLNVEAVPSERHLHGEMWLNLAAVDRLVEAEAETAVHARGTVRKLREGEPIEVSIGYRSSMVETPGEFDGTPYSYRLVGIRPDHLAALPFDRGGRNPDRQNYAGDPLAPDAAPGDGAPADVHIPTAVEDTGRSDPPEPQLTPEEYAAACEDAVERLSPGDTIAFQIATMDERGEVRTRYAVEDAIIPVRRALTTFQLCNANAAAKVMGCATEDVLREALEWNDLQGGAR